MTKLVIAKDSAGWTVTQASTGRVLLESERKRDATTRARVLLKRAGGGELVIKNLDGEVLEVEYWAVLPSR